MILVNNAGERTVPAMSDIFISYSRNDRSKAETLARALAEVGWSVWWDRNIPAGKDFAKVIEAALKGSKVAIVLWSEHSLGSRWVLTEADAAADRGILVPILIERNLEVPFAFRRIQAADLSEWDGDIEAPSFRSLVADIKDRIGTHAPQVETPEPENHPVLVPDPVDEERPPQPPRGSWSLGPRARPTLVVAAVFGINLVETKIESIVRDRFGWGVDLGNQLAAAFRGLERNLSFESHDVTNWFAVYGYSVAYFFVLPAIGLAVGVLLWRREDVHAYRILCLSIAADYLISLGFFLFFPVPERWSYADSGAILLSDRWSSQLIELVRPISAMDNCFPSTHVSLTVVLILVSYMAGLRLRHTFCALGTSVAISTFVLGIHWLPDIVAGVAVGVLSVSLARSLEARRNRAASGTVPAGGAGAASRLRRARVGALAHS
jgi:membrane-associated phospholipid phosphatase